MARTDTISQPRSWHQHIKSAFIHTIALAAGAISVASGKSATRRSKLARLQARLNKANHEIALLKEEMRIKDFRFSRISPHRRPHYRPTEWMQILKLKAARGWSMSQIAAAILLSELTIFSWHQRIDEEGDCGLLQMSDPVNKYSYFVRAIVQQMKAFFPKMARTRLLRYLREPGFTLAPRLCSTWTSTVEPLPNHHLFA